MNFFGRAGWLNIPAASEEARKFLHHQSGQHLYFHGTIHAGATSLLEDGIDLRFSKESTDFCPRGGGYYVGYDFKNAALFGKGNDGAQGAAVVIFSFSDDEDAEWRSKWKGLCLDPNAHDPLPVQADWRHYYTDWRQLWDMILSYNRLRATDYSKKYPGSMRNFTEAVDTVKIRKHASNA